MNEPNRPRKLNTSGAQHKTTYHASSAGQSAGGARRTVHTHAAPASQPARSGGAKKKTGSRKKKNGCLVPLLVTLAVLLVIVLAAWQIIMHAIKPDSDSPSLKDLITSIGTPDEYSGDVVNILVCGIDSDDGETRSYGDGTNDGMTDMIMYVNFDVKNKKASLLQIPRNTFVGGTITTPNGTYSARNGQINSVMISNEEGMTALCDVISNTLQLPIDHYITINMAAMKEVVNLFGGVEVYVPQDMAYGGSVLKQGYQTLDGSAAEFFVRNRHGAGFERSDLDRLNMQRYFYSGLLGKIRTMTLKDAVKLTPAFMNYVTTDLDTVTIAKLAVSLLKTDSANIMLCQMPVYNCGERYVVGTTSHSVVVGATGETATLLNQYFREYTGEVPAENLHFTSWATAGAPSDPNVQYMGQLDTERENGQQNENLDGSYTVTADNTAVQ